MILLDDDTAEELADTTSVNIEFSKDNQTATASFEIRKSEDATLGVLTLDSSMVRYATDRYVDIELILENQSGLKIPKSSVIEKEFYTVPEDYLTQGGNSNNTGVLVDDGSDSASFQEAEVYYRDNETGMIYLDRDLFKEGTVLRKEDSDQTYTCRIPPLFKAYIISIKGMLSSARLQSSPKAMNTTSSNPATITGWQTMIILP